TAIASVLSGPRVAGAGRVRPSTLASDESLIVTLEVVTSYRLTGPVAVRRTMLIHLVRYRIILISLFDFGFGR
ncbi:MAG TPA: hypothetical protein VIW23_14625, partial [Candidatus Acidoferrum sp.]